MGRLSIERKRNESVILRDRTGKLLGNITVKSHGEAGLRMVFDMDPSIQILREEVDKGPNAPPKEISKKGT